MLTFVEKKEMKFATEQLITDLTRRTNALIQEAEQLNQLPETTLNFKTNPESWSALECIQHLNLYGRFYLPEIDRRLAADKSHPPLQFKSGWLGNYFAKSMLPKENLNKMKTFANMNPINSTLDKAVITEFLEQQRKMLQLLEKARRHHLGKVKTNISISKLIRLKLGDTFRFVIYHNDRHMQQAERMIQTMKNHS